jgi:hypothetical protein
MSLRRRLEDRVMRRSIYSLVCPFPLIIAWLRYGNVLRILIFTGSWVNALKNDRLLHVLGSRGGRDKSKVP